MTRQEFQTIRNGLGRTQKEIASKLCLSLSSVKKMEQGHRPITARTAKQMIGLQYAAHTNA